MESNINSYLRIAIVNHIIFLLLVPQSRCGEIINQCNGIEAGGLLLFFFLLLQAGLELIIISAFIISMSSKTILKATQLNTALFFVTLLLAFNAVF
ncbi:hypothetical protein [Colwellia sp. TT2012]|uniref:hypothetical protein n=1 Tax=Colwellia sp. TT2012 TaxID=1720342 RepID=UPI00071036E4|nr:hypothetical protein [Colwellia sp. TT2012]